MSSGKGDLFSTFVNSIVGQQISVIAAEAIWNRLKERSEKSLLRTFPLFLQKRLRLAD